MERNNQASNNIEVFETLSASDVIKMYDKLDDHKKETKQEINKVEERLKKQNEGVKEELKLIKAQQVEFSKQQNNTNIAINNTNTALNLQAERLNNLERLTQENFRILNDRMNNIAQNAIQNNEIPIPKKPTREEESDISSIFGEKCYKILKTNAMIITQENLQKAAKEALEKSILACKITNVVYEEKKSYNEREKNRNDKYAKRDKLVNDLDKLEEEYEVRRPRIAKDVRDKKVASNVLTQYDESVEQSRRDIKSEADLNSKDIKKLKNEFLCVFERIGSNASYVKEILAVADVVVNVCVAIKEYVERKKAEAEREEEFKTKANELKEELITMTNDRKKETFEKANAVYLARYYATYGRDDISYHPRNTNGDDSVYYVFSGIDRKFSLIPNFQEFFVWQGLLGERIENFKEKLKEVYSQEEIPKLYKDYLPYIKEKDYLNFIHNDKKNEFKVKYQLYRALSQLAEFDEMKKCGDDFALGKGIALSSISVLPGAVFLTICIATGPIGWGIAGIAGAVTLGLGVGNAVVHGTERGIKEHQYSENIPNLKEVMRMYLVVAGRLDEILKTKCIYARLKYYNDWTKSKYGKDLLEKNEKMLNYEFTNKEAEENFEQAFDLYQKISNQGIADRENYIDYTFEYRNIGVQIVNHI